MESNNIENQIKNSLQNRELQPSAKAWDRLDAMLTVAEEKKVKKVFFWNPKYLAIAAAFVLIGTLVFINADNSKIKETNSVVNKENEPIQLKENNAIILPELQQQVATTETINTAEKEERIGRTQTNQKGLPNQNSILSQQINHQSKNVLDNQTTNQELAEAIIPKAKENKTILSVSDADLLAMVDNASKTNHEKTIQINSRSMLFQVTSEINQEYRETNFQKLKRNFETVKVAISNRNIQ
jgi:hypothetical protein